MAIEIYVIPAITNDKVLPTSTIHSSYLSNQITSFGCPGQSVPASFVIKAIGEDILSLTPQPENLAGTGLILSSAVDIRAVKCWWQKRGGKHLTPELLLKNDSLVKVEGDENYLRRPDGTYMWISDPTPNDQKRWSVVEIPAIDTDTLQPLNIPSGTNKQFLVTIKIPAGAYPGIYTGTISLVVPAGVIGSVEVNLTVLPVTLLETYLEYSIYYTPRISNTPNISSSTKSEQQMRAEFEDMIEHNIIGPTMYQGVYQSTLDVAQVEQVLTLRDEVGLGDKPLYWIIHGPRENQDPAIVPQLLSIAHSHGITDVYFYGEDESLGHRVKLNPDGTETPISSAETVQKCADQIPAWEQIHALGGKIFVAGVKVGHYSDARSIGEYGIASDHIDVFVAFQAPSRAEAARWHSKGKRILSYADPVVGKEEPETYRRNYGLKLWQGNYDGCMPWAYNYFSGNPWNPFDSWSDQAFGYPTVNGVIDNLAFEGWREGVTDTRYLTTLLNAIDVAKTQGKNTSAAEIYLSNLKETNLELVDLDLIRREMANHITILQGAPVSPGGGEMALKFNGVSGHVDCGSNPILNPAGKFTLELWMNPSATEAEQVSNSGPICKADDGALGWSWQLRYRTTDTPEGYLGFQVNTPEGPVWVSVNQNLLPGYKYYIAVVYDGTNLSMLVNNVLTDQVAISGVEATDAPLLIGQDGWGSIFNGVVDEGRFSDIDRSDAERLAAWNGGVGTKFVIDGNTIALWHMDTGVGTTVYDGTGINNGLISGDVEWVAGLISEPQIPGTDLSSILEAMVIVMIVVMMMGIITRREL